MATKLITFLGTNPYLECNYYFEDPIKEFYLTRFVQISIIRSIIDKFNDNSEILFLTTAAAKEQNWEDIKFENGEIRKGLKSELERLKNYLENKNKKLPKYHLVDIPEGKSESELWDIFNIITKIVDEDDEIYFDITHSFRSLPMLALVVLNYLRVIKGITIKQIFYGAFETIGRIKDAEKLAPENRHVPIFDLTPFENLLSWATAADHFIQTGNPLPLTLLTDKETIPVLRKTKGQDEAARALKIFSYRLGMFFKNLSIAKSPDLYSNFFQLKKSIQSVQNHIEAIPPLSKLFDKIKIEFDSALPSEENINLQDKKLLSNFIRNINKSIDYSFKFGLIQQGFTLLEENIITYGCFLFDLDYKKPIHRRLLTTAFGLKKNKKPENEWRFLENLDREFQIEIIKKIIQSPIDEIVLLWQQVSEKRNSINHAGYSYKNIEYQNLLTTGRDMLQRFEEIIKQ